MKANKIATKIKITGALLVGAIFTIISATIYLNEQISKDASIINMAGKQRMLTQMISKNVFYINSTKKFDFEELDGAVKQFGDSLYKLTHGDYNEDIYVVSNKQITSQLLKVTQMWSSFNSDVQLFKHNVKLQTLDTNTLVRKIFESNVILLHEMDKLVGMYASNSEEQNNDIITFQYYAALILVLIMIYALKELKSIENKVNDFLNYTKQLANSDDYTNVTDVDTQETELVEAKTTLNCFINKLNTAVEESNNAIEHSQKASSRLEEITDEFADVLEEIENSPTIEDAMDKSEDMIIEYSEELRQSRKKLQHLKEEMDKLLNSCR